MLCYFQKGDHPKVSLSPLNRGVVGDVQARPMGDLILRLIGREPALSDPRAYRH